MKSGRGEFRASREKAEEPDERVETRVVAGREGQQSGGRGSGNGGGWLVEKRAGSGGREGRRWKRGL